MINALFLDSRFNGTQCVDGLDECPWDRCNKGKCIKGCNSGACTRKGCPNGHTKKENQLCVMSRNNCQEGLQCVKQDDGCNNEFGRCVKPSKENYQMI